MNVARISMSILQPLRQKVLSKTSSNKKEKILALPHETSLRARSYSSITNSHDAVSVSSHGSADSTISFSHSQDNNDSSLKQDNDEEQAIHDTPANGTHRKVNIFIQSMHSIRQPMNIEVAASEHSLYSPRSCTICCEDYREGDEIAWSRNEECRHAYHVECILHWLMKHNDCPLCRSNYCSKTPLKPTFPIARQPNLRSSQDDLYFLESMF